MKVTLARVPVTTRWLVAALASALVLLGVVLASAVMSTETSATWLASSASPGGIALSPHNGGGIYKHIWLDAIGPQVSVPHVDTSVHQSR